jgi:hypothetical protein
VNLELPIQGGIGRKIIDVVLVIVVLLIIWQFLGSL